jgi:diguanylate cyclase (GGDEF)-like protein/PAS domain S-box-containing protein
VLGHDPATLVGRSLFALVDYHDVALARADVAQIIAAPDEDRDAAASPCEWRMRHAERGERWVEVMSTNLLHDPAVRGIVINARDVTERKELEAELRHRAYHDSLTGLANRGRFHTAVTDALSSLRRAAASRALEGAAPPTMLAVIIVDLDDFKPVNDGHGHAAGDQLLRAISRRLRGSARDADVVARLGGDEFAILLGRVADEAEARAIAERVLESVQRPLEVAHERVTVGASIGVACAAIDRDEEVRDGTAGHYVIPAGVDAVEASETMLHAADAAMYAAKSSGGRGVVVAHVAVAISAPQRA